MDAKQALDHHARYRALLQDAAHVPDKDKAADKRSCYELVTLAYSLDSRKPHHAMLQGAAQVIDDLVLALKAQAGPV